VITGLDGNIEYVNSKFTQATGYTAAEVIGNNPRILKSGETSPQAYQQMWDTITSGKEWRGEFHNRKKDGTLYWESASLSPVMDGQGRITHYLAVKEDITQRKQMELMLKQSNESLTALHESSLEFLHQRDFNELMQSLVEHAMVLMNAPFAMILMAEEEDLVVRGKTHHIPFVLGEHYTRETEMPSWQAIDSMEVIVENNFPNSQGPKDGLERPLYATAVFPIISGNYCLGTLSLGRDLPDFPFTPDQVQVGKLFAQIAALAMENVQLSTEMHELSIRDPLTGLHNRRYLFEVLPREKARALRSGHPISFALIDIDYFKDVNDLYGHGAGDTALCALADLLSGLIRAGDILCRYGGDELIAVMYNTPAPVALERANQWRRAAADLHIEYQDRVLGLTISLGIASFPQHGATIDEVIGRADHALYQSKNRGRNRATLYGYGASINLPESVPSDAR
jgi:diguanylate cyclase (GGDEF)-like protein/PAS domain S-box-containing protein